jgi:hypothetical protein
VIPRVPYDNAVSFDEESGVAQMRIGGQPLAYYTAGELRPAPSRTE